MKSFVLALLAATAATPAFAIGEFAYPTFLAQLDVEGAWDNAADLAPEPGFFDRIELAGGNKIALDRTSIFDLAELFGNGVQTYQHLGYTTSWLCYTDAGRRIWYIADLTYETSDEVKISMIVDEPADPLTDTIFRCAPEPRAMLATQPTLPTIGATQDDLETRFKLEIPTGTTLASGRSDAGREGSGIYDMKIVTYRLTDGIVDAVYIAEDYVNDNEDMQ